MREINIGGVIAKKRREKDVTQEELAEYIGVSKASVSKWETGQSYPDVTFLPQLAAYFNVTLDELMDYSPQMTSENISKTYCELSARFSNEDFQSVLADCREIIRKYYSCYPLVMQMALLLFNYSAPHPASEERSALLREIAGLCERVRTESNNLNLYKTALMLEAYCLLLLNEPQTVLELLGEKAEPHDMRESLIAQAYTAMGKSEKAKKITQGICLSSLVNFFESATSYIGLCMEDFCRTENFFSMTLAVADATNFEKLNANGALLLYTTGAQLYCIHNQHDRAIELLWKVTDLCTKRFFPLKTSGNEFFDGKIIEEMLADADMPTHIPRSEKVIKESMLGGIFMNPVFAPLSENSEYIKIINIFKEFVEEK